MFTVLPQTELDSSRESWDVSSRRQDIIDANQGWESHLAVILANWTGYERYFDQKHEYLVARTKMRTLITELAILMHQLETGRLADGLEDLVPDYVPTLPDDPFGEGPLQYRVEGESYTLYSVGPNGRDDGGQPLSSDRSEGDLTIDELFPAPQVAASPSVGASSVGAPGDDSE